MMKGQTMKLLILFCPLFLCISSLSASNDFIEAGKHFKIDARLLWAIAYKESRFNPNAISKANKNGSYDIGIMQINSSHLWWLKRDFNIEKEDLLNPSINIYIGALILKRCFNIHGYTKQGITCYNGKITNNPYGQEVLEILTKAQNKHKKQITQKKVKEYFSLEKQRLFVKQIK